MPEVPLIDIRPDQWSIVQGILQKHVPQYDVWAFGSRAKWTAKPYSDLDLAVICDQPLSLAISAALADDFSDSDLPWKVDVVDWATTSEAFRSIIGSHKVVVQIGLTGSNSWRHITIEDIAERIAIGPFGSRMTSDCYTDRGVPVIRGTNITGGRNFSGEWVYVSDEKANELKSSNVFSGDLVFPHRGSIGEVGIVPADRNRYLLSSSLMMLRSDKLQAQPLFLYYFFRSAAGRHELLKNASQVGTPGIGQPLSSLRQIALSLPPPNEQQAIGQILGTIDDKIELNRRSNETLEAMARAVFKDWFIDFGPVRAKLEGLQPYLAPEIWALFPDEGDEVGLPLGWQAVPLSELIELNPTEKLKKGDDAPYVDMASLPTSGSWSEPPIRRPFGSGMKFRNGDTLLARITPCLENGKSTFMQNLPEGQVGWGSTEFIVMRAKGPVPAEFAYLLARDPVFRASAIRSMTGTSGRQRAQAGVIADYPLLNCPDELWLAFGKVVKPLFEVIKANSEESIALAAQRDLLLPKLILGDLRIANSHEFLAEASA